MCTDSCCGYQSCWNTQFCQMAQLQAQRHHRHGVSSSFELRLKCWITLSQTRVLAGPEPNEKVRFGDAKDVVQKQQLRVVFTPVGPCAPFLCWTARTHPVVAVNESCQRSSSMRQ